MSAKKSYISSLEPRDRDRDLEKLTVSPKYAYAGKTSNPEVAEVSGVRLPDPYSLTGWKDDLSLWPDTDYGCIYTYLIGAPGPFSGEAMRAYKSLEAYNLFASGHVREMRYHPIDSNIQVCYLKAAVMPGQRVTDSPHKPWVSLTKKEGYVVAAHCTCMAGFVGVFRFLGNLELSTLLENWERCAAMWLHCYLQLTRPTLSRSTRPSSCTSKKAVWSNYYKEKVDPQRAEEMDLSHPRHGVQSKKVRRKPQCDVPPLSEEETAAAFSHPFHIPDF